LRSKNCGKHEQYQNQYCAHNGSMSLVGNVSQGVIIEQVAELAEAYFARRWLRMQGRVKWRRVLA
jgi:hypothetical protein